MKKRTATRISRQLLFLFLLCFFTSSAFSASKEVALFVPRSSVFWDTFSAFSRAAAKDLGLNLKIFNAEDSPEQMLKQVQTAAGNHLDALLFINYGDIGESILKIAEQNAIPAILVNTGFEDPLLFPRAQYRYWIGSIAPDDTRAGARLVTRLIEEAEKQGVNTKYIIADTGRGSDRAHLNRYQGLLSVVEARSDVVLVDALPTIGNKWNIQNQFKQVLQEHPETNIVWSYSDVHAQELAEHYHKTGASSSIVFGGIDWIGTAMQAVADDLIDIDLGGHIFDGAQAAIMIHDYLHGRDFAEEQLVFNSPMIEANKKNIATLQQILSDPETIDYKALSKTHSPDRKQYQFDLDTISQSPQPSISFTAEEKLWIKNHPTIRFTGDPNWLPYEAYAVDGEYLGVVSNVLDVLTERTGLKIEHVPSTSWSHALKLAADGEVDVISDDPASEPVQRTHNFTRPYLQEPLSVVMREERSAPLTSLFGISDQRIAIVKGYGYIWQLFKKYPEINFIEVENVQEGLTGVDEKKFDAFIATSLLSRYHINHMRLEQLHIVGQLPIVLKLGLGVRNDQSVLLSILDKSIASITQKDIHLLVERWMDQHYKVVINYRDVWIVLSIALVLIGLTLLWNRMIRRQRAQLQLSKKRYRLAMEAVSEAVWEFDLNSGDAYVSDGFFKHLGYANEEIPRNHQQWLEMLHPDDREGYTQAFAENIQYGKEGAAATVLECRLRAKSGDYIDIEARGRVVEWDEYAKPTIARGTLLDITRRKQANEQFKALIKALPLAVIVADTKGVILMENPQAILEVGGEKSLVGRNTMEFYADENERENILATLASKGKVVNRQIKYRITSGEIIDCLLSVIPTEYDNAPALLGVMVNVTERVKLEQTLALAREQADQASRFKSEFLANMSHEIRTPMNAVVGLGHLLAKTPLDAKQQSYLGKMEQSSESLLRVIDDILDFSKIEAGKLLIELVDFDLEEVLTHLATLAESRIENKSMEFIYHVDSNIPSRLRGDPHRLGQILTNLVSNAMKFTERGHVQLKISLDDSNNSAAYTPVNLHFSVEDTGIGIERYKLNEIFTSFVQADGSTTRRYGGTGLGLAICRQLTRLMGGELRAKSTLGEGSNFEFSLPFEVPDSVVPIQPSPDLRGLQVLLVDDHPTALEAIGKMLTSLSFNVDAVSSATEALKSVQAKQAGYDLVIVDGRMEEMDGLELAGQIRALFDAESTTRIFMTTTPGEENLRFLGKQTLDGILTKPVTPSPLLNTIVTAWTTDNTKQPPVNRTITEAQSVQTLVGDVLLVEDNEINQLVAREILEQMGLSVAVCENGLKAVAFIKKNQPDLVLMDIQMPVMDGFEATRQIRQLRNTESLAIVAMTAHAMAGDAEKCIQAGMNDHIAKPIDPDLLHNRIKHWLKLQNPAGD